MKPVFTPLAILLSLLLFSSCKKDWACVCADPNGHENTTTLSRLTEKDAQVACEILATDDLSCQLR